jgi:RES domain-containing protein
MPHLMHHMMSPLPAPLSAGPVTGWRVDYQMRAPTWDSGKGAQTDGGRWNPEGFAAVYCSIDPATAILEVAVHKRFSVLDTVPHVLTSLEVLEATDIHVVQPGDVPNPGWLVPGAPSDGQQRFGMALLVKHPFILIPSTVSARSWNLLFNPGVARNRYRLRQQEALAIDTRLHPPQDRPPQPLST